MVTEGFEGRTSLGLGGGVAKFASREIFVTESLLGYHPSHKASGGRPFGFAHGEPDLSNHAKRGATNIW